MTVTQHGNNLFQLTRLWAINCYLVREDDGFTLIDTSISGSATMILAAARAHGLPIQRLTLTHAHVDHVGSLDQLCPQLPQAEIAFSQRTARFIAGDLVLEPHEPQTKLRGGFTPCTTQATRLLNAGDKVGSLEVVAAPGHTPDHLAFFDPRDGTLIAGDAFQTRGGVAVAGTFRWAFPFPAWATWHKETALKTARHLRQLTPTRLAVGHGPVIENPAEVMEAAINTATQALSESPQS